MSKRYEFIGASVCCMRSANTSSKGLLSFSQVTLPGFSLYWISKWAGSPAVHTEWGEVGEGGKKVMDENYLFEKTNIENDPKDILVMFLYSGAL